MMLNAETQRRITREITSYFQGTLEERIKKALEEVYAEGFQAGRKAGAKETRETLTLEEVFKGPSEERTIDQGQA